MPRRMLPRPGIALALLGFSPLAVLAWWAYLPAVPYKYPGLEELLLNTYYGAAQQGDELSMLLRAGVLVLYASMVSAAVLWKQATLFGALLSGVLGAFILIQPAAVPWVLQAEPGSALSMLACLGLLCLLLGALARRYVECALPLAVSIMLAGTWLSVSTAAVAVIRSTPPLFVLDRAAQQPESALANLALGMQFLSIADMHAAAPYLQRAGQKILSDTDGDYAPAVYAAAQRIAEISLDPENGTAPDPEPTIGELAKP